MILSKPIVLVGMMGCGKSTIGKIVAEKLNWIFLKKNWYKSVTFLFKCLPYLYKSVSYLYKSVPNMYIIVLSMYKIVFFSSQRLYLNQIHHEWLLYMAL